MDKFRTKQNKLNKKKSFKNARVKMTRESWPVSLSWLEHHPLTEGLGVQLLVRTQTWGVGSIPSPECVIPGLGACGRQLTNASFLR